MKKENPEADFMEISNTLGAKWKSLSAEEKNPYEEKYLEDKEAYLQVVGKEKRETEATKLHEEEQMQKTAMELLEQYLKFKQVWNNKRLSIAFVLGKFRNVYMGQTNFRKLMTWERKSQGT
jgi:HMG (high mobility group) box